MYFFKEDKVKFYVGCKVVDLVFYEEGGKNRAKFKSQHGRDMEISSKKRTPNVWFSLFCKILNFIINATWWITL